MTRSTNDPSLAEALAIPGRAGVTARKATGAHPDCRCGRRPDRPSIGEHWTDEPMPRATPEMTRQEWRAVMNAWHDRCAAPFHAALAAWESERRCPQHDPERRL